MAAEALSVDFEHSATFVQLRLVGRVEATSPSERQWQRAFADLRDAVHRSGVSIAVVDARGLRDVDVAALQWLTAWLQGDRSFHVQLYFDGRVEWQRRDLASLQFAVADCAVFDYGVCPHERIDEREDHFFASTGSGSTVTVTFCVDCGEELARQSERFD